MATETSPDSTTTVLTPGSPAPDFTLPTQDREDWTLSEKLAQGDVVLCFFPLAFTGVCTTEMECITKEFASWTEKGAQVVGISCDSFAVTKAWSEQLGLTHTLLADMHRSVCKDYGLYWPKLNVASRGTVVVSASDAGPVVKWSQSREPSDAMDLNAVLAQLA